MNCTEFESKQLFAQYNIPTPASRRITSRVQKAPLPAPFVLKSQVPVGDRMKKGGIIFIDRKNQFKKAKADLFALSLDGHKPSYLLAEEKISPQAERYVSFSFNTNTRTPTLALASHGGTGINTATLTSIDTVWDLPQFMIRNALQQAQLPPSRSLVAIVQSLWQLFCSEKALLVEINPLFELSSGEFLAGDGKIILDDAIANPNHRPFLQMDGDVAVIASGGGASMLNLDALMKAGGKPANYVEYSGNPKADVVADLTHRTLSKPGLKGCWVVGGTANFTDIYETLTGFMQGLQSLKKKPTYPIVIRRDGPRRAEAFAMLDETNKQEGYNIHLFGPETPMSDSAKILMKLIHEHSH